MKRRLLLWTVVLLLPVLALSGGCANLGRKVEEPATRSDDFDLNIETPPVSDDSRRRNSPGLFSLSPAAQDIERSLGAR